MEERTTITKEKKKGLALILCLLGGIFGLHKFYEEKIFVGILYLCTFGFFGVGVIIDLFRLIRKPSVYSIEKTPLKVRIHNFPLQGFGIALSVIGGLIIFLSMAGLIGDADANRWLASETFVGLGIGVLGMVMSFLKTRNVKNSFLFNAIVMVLTSFALYALLVLTVAVVIWLVLKLVFGFDILELVMAFFSNDDDNKTTSRPAEEEDYTSRVLSVFDMPSQISGPYENTYSRVSIDGDTATYTCAETNDTVIIHSSQIEVSALGFYANTKDGYFTW